MFLAGLIALFTLSVAQYPNITPPTVVVTASYPGANAQTVLDTVAAPIEQQVSGVENMLYMSSQCTNDGFYILTITFMLGMDADMAQVLVQNRVSLGLPNVPDLVQRQGVPVKKMSPSTMMIVNLLSDTDPETGKLIYNDLYLSNYATIQIKDELARLPGVANVTFLGQRDYSMRAWLNPDKMAILGLTASDVMNALEEQNIQVAAGMVGQQPVPTGQQLQLTINTLGRLDTVQQFEDIVVKVGQRGSQGQTDGSGPAARHRPRGPRRPAVRPELHAGRPALGGAVGLPAARLQRPPDGEERLRQDERVGQPLPRRAALQDRLRHDAVHP